MQMFGNWEAKQKNSVLSEEAACPNYPGNKNVLLHGYFFLILALLSK